MRSDIIQRARKCGALAAKDGRRLLVCECRAGVKLMIEAKDHSAAMVADVAREWRNGYKTQKGKQTCKTVK